MNAYRICKTQYAQDMSGLDAMLTGGRWNSAGNAVLYTSENSALAAIELATHVDLSILPDNLSLVTYDIPEVITIEVLKNPPKGWEAIPPNQLTKYIGDDFITKSEAQVLKVPSVVINGAFNYLINPSNKDSQLIKIGHIEDFSFDQRLRHV